MLLSLRPIFAYTPAVPGTAKGRRARWIERYPLVRLGTAGDLLAALAATALATFLRFLIADHLPPGFPFLTYFPAVILIAVLLGTRAGLLTALFSGTAAWYWFLAPSSSWLLDIHGQLAMGFYVFVTGIEVALVHWMQRANRLLVAEREAHAQLAETRQLLFRELQHRVSNNLQMVASLLTIQRRQLQDESARAALDEAARRLHTIGKISRQLYDPGGSERQLRAFLDQLAREVIDTASSRPVTHSVEGDGETSIAAEAAIPLALVVAETIANAIEHGFAGKDEDCRLTIRLQPEGRKGLAIEIEDNGRGLPAGFDLERSDSLGLKIATMLARQMGGRFSLSPAPVRGTLARLELPLEPA